MSVLSEAGERHARFAAELHNTATEDDGWIVCKCGVPFPFWDDWGDHYAQEVLDAALQGVDGMAIELRLLSP